MQVFSGRFAHSACGAFALAAMIVTPAVAEVAKETATLGDYTITLHLHPFLTQEDLTVLRFVTTSADALALFVPEASGHAAVAVSPDEGFVKDGAPMPSVIALGALPDAATAAADSIAACQKTAPSKTPCVVVLEIAPK